MLSTSALIAAIGAEIKTGAAARAGGIGAGGTGAGAGGAILIDIGARDLLALASDACITRGVISFLEFKYK